MIYYRYLFKHLKELSPNEGLVYSALLSHSLRSYSEIYDSDGNFSVENAIAIVADYMEDDMGVIDYSPVSTRRLSKLLNMKEDTIRGIKERLEWKHRLIDGNVIKCPLELLEHGYLDISPDIKLKGRQLVFYGLLKDRSTPYNGTIDTWASVLAEKAGISKRNARKLLAEIEDKEYAERLDNGKLRIK